MSIMQVLLHSHPHAAREDFPCERCGYSIECSLCEMSHAHTGHTSDGQVYGDYCSCLREFEASQWQMGHFQVLL